MAVLDQLRYAADLALAVPAQIGRRVYMVTLIQNTYSGTAGYGPGRIGGTKTTTSTVLTNSGGVNIDVMQVSQSDVVLSGGLIRSQDLVLGPIVFPYNTGTVTGGFDVANFQPTDGYGSPVEIYFQISGPGMASPASYFQKIYEKATDKVLMYRVYVRAVALQTV